MSKLTEGSKIIGENIKAARQIRGLSQRELAEKIGIAFQNLSVWENGKGAPSAKYLVKLSEILSVSLDQLTSKDAIFARTERALSGLNQFGVRSEETEINQVDIRLRRILEEEVPKLIRRELGSSDTFKLIVQYLEEIRITLRDFSQGNKNGS